MKEFLLYGHGGAYNHGAEAIVKTTIKIIREKYGDNAYIAISSHFPEQDKEYGIDADEFFRPAPEMWGREQLAREMYKDALDFIASDTICLSVGGDNYCYPNWHRQAVFQEEIARKGAKSILWGCSVEPSAITNEMAGVLSTYTHILARESITYHALKANNVDTDVQLLPDPAFLLEPEPVALPELFNAEKTIGINISPLVIRKENSSGIVMENIYGLIDHVLTQTDMTIAFIPYVVMPMDNDHDALSEIESMFPQSSRSRLWLADEKYSAAEIKYIISKCKLLVCARTHASIAAYSSCVPALVIGYSVKAKGIAEDLEVGEFVIDVSEIESKHSIKDLFVHFFDNADEIESLLVNNRQYNKQAVRYANYI